MLTPLYERLNAIYDATTAEAIRATFETPKRVGWTLNPLRSGTPADTLMSADTLVSASTPVPGLDGCFSVPAHKRDWLMAHPAVEAGAVYPMNPSSFTASRLLGVEPPHEVLDLAAAPGGKTLQLAIAMNNSGRIAAVEPVKGRFHRLRANLARCGVENTEFYLADGRSIGRKVPDRFDRVLLDTPCSSESRIRLDEPETFAHWSPRKTKEVVRKQRGLIRSAYAALKPGGEMIYCTCAFSVEENEGVVAHLLQHQPEAEILPAAIPGSPGLTVWRDRPLDERLASCRRILPDDLFDGFFVARIGKPAG